MANERIMVVEDEWVVADDIVNSLENLGYTVTSVVSSGPEAIQKAGEDKPDIILMDIVLQGDMDGIEATKEIRSHFSIPVIYLTAYADKKVLERAKITEPFGYMIKPFEERELNIVIQMALYRRKMEEERERLLHELNSKNKELRQIVYVTSHDLRSPLINIQGFTRELMLSIEELSSILKDDNIPSELKEKLVPVLEDDIPDSLKYILTSTSKIDSLLSSLLHLSRIGRKALIIKQLDMNKLVSDVVKAMEFNIGKIDALVEIEDLPSCKGDSIQINQIFSNLIDNALKYRGPDRRCNIKVTGRKVAEHVEYYVQDNGIGIAKEHQDRIYEIFLRLDPNRGEGEGLGLTIIRTILDRHNGSISVVSRPDKGSKFTVTLPA